MTDRHPIDRDQATRLFKSEWKKWQWFKDVATSDSAQLSTVRDEAMRLVGQFCVFEPESDEIPSLLTLAADAVVANFQLAQLDEGKADVQLGDDLVRLTGTGRKPSYVSPSVWIDGFLIAAIARRRAALEGLCEITSNVFERVRGGESPEYMYLFVEALRSFLQAGAERGELVMSAMEATDPSRILAGTDDYVLSIDVFTIEAMIWIVAQEHDRFIDCLRRGVDSHREYHSVKGRRQDRRGFISTPLTGLAAIAHDLGWQVDVQSDYLPTRLLLGEWREDKRSIYSDEPFPGGRLCISEAGGAPKG